MKTTFMAEFIKAAKDTPRMYFAPLMGIIDAMRREWNRPFIDGGTEQPAPRSRYNRRRKAPAAATPSKQDNGAR